MNLELLERFVVRAILVAAVLFVAFVAFVVFIIWHDGGLDRAEDWTDPSQYADRTPQWSPDGQYIIANLGHSIYRVPVTTGPVERTPDKPKAGQYSPSLAPDGQIAYIDYDHKKNETQLRITNTQGQDPLTVHDAAYFNVHGIPYRNHVIEWSPDGSHLFYLRRLDVEDVRGVLAVMDAEDGPDVTWQLPWFDVGAAVWSPDSRHIAIWRVNAVDGYILSTVRREGAAETVIDKRDPDSLVNLSEPGWSDDGGLYYVKREVREGNGHSLLYRTDANGQERRLVADLTAQAPTLDESRTHTRTPTPRPTGTQVMGEVLAVKPSPDGSMMLFIANATAAEAVGNRGTDVFLWRVGDQTMVRLPTIGYGWNSGAVPSASWSPEGQWIAVVEANRGSLTIFNSDGGDGRVLIEDARDVEPEKPWQN